MRFFGHARWTKNPKYCTGCFRMLSSNHGGAEVECSLLFADVRGSTTLAESMSPREFNRLMGRFLDTATDVLVDHDGIVDKFVGDEIIGLFGAPIQLDDAVFKAVVCALDMLKSLREFNRTRQAENQPPILIGIGVNTGKVITGAIGSTRALQYTAIGDAMNIASRLVSLAKPNEIIVSDHTYQRIKDRVEAVPLPPVMVKGKAEEQKIFRVLGLRGARDWLADPTHS